LKISTKKGQVFTDYRVTATLGVAISGLIFLTPFAINNFIQGRPILGAGSLAIVALLAITAWSTWRGHDHPWLTFVGLMPAIIVFLVVAFQKQGIIGALWCYPAVIATYFMLPERMAWVANGVLLSVIIPTAWTVLDHPVALRVGVTLVVVSTFSAVFIRIITGQQRRLQEQAITDVLTGLRNRTLLKSTLDQALEQSHRARTPMTLLALDLDNFKEVNDTLGHDAGDDVLRRVATMLRARIRRADHVFRIGGEEFLVLLHGTGEDMGKQFAEELRCAIESLAIPSQRPITVSIGIANLRNSEDWKGWMKRADENLYRAKSEGRNRVIT